MVLIIDSAVPLVHHDPSDLGLICSVKKHKIRFWILESNLEFSLRNAPIKSDLYPVSKAILINCLRLFRVKMYSLEFESRDSAAPPGVKAIEWPGPICVRTYLQLSNPTSTTRSHKAISRKIGDHNITRRKVSRGQFFLLGKVITL